MLTVERHSEPEPLFESLPADRLHELLAALPEQQRELLTLSEVGGLSVSALAQIQECTRETASERLKQARRALRRALEASQVPANRESDIDAAPPTQLVEGAIETADSFDYIEDDGCICVLGAKTFVVWRRGPSASLLGILKEAMRKSMEREGPKLTFMAIVEAGSATVPIDRETRQINTEIMRMLGSCVRGAAVAVETEGVFNLVPAVINTARFLSRSAIPFRFFTNVASAATWLAPRCEGESPSSLVAQAEWMRARLDARKLEVNAQS